MGLGKIIRKIPPFKYLYHQIDTLKNQNEKLSDRCKNFEKKYDALIKKYDKLFDKYQYIWEVEQRFEKNMSMHHEMLKDELRNTRQEISDIGKVQDVRHKDVIARIEGNHKAIVEKERTDFRRLEEISRQLAKDIEYYYYKGLHPDQYENSIKEWYFGRTGENLDLENPTTYNEKIQWMKLYDSTQLKADLADKYCVREYVRERIGEQYLIPLLGVWANVDDIPFDDLPEQYVLKANHGCGYNIIVKDKKQFHQEDAKKKLSKWLKTNFAYSAGLELHYKMIKPVIIAEQYIENLNGELNDYKVFCFNGKARYIMFLKDRQTKLKMAFYDTEWNLMPFVYSHERLTEEIPRPDNLDELIRISEKLAEGFPHVRVDFYRLNNGEYRFGELTFTSFSGACIWTPPEYNKILGDLIELPEKNNN